MPKISKIGLSHDDIHEEIIKNKYTIQIIQNDIESIKNNHLKHIEDDMDSINKKVDKLDEKFFTIETICIKRWYVTMVSKVLIGLFKVYNNADEKLWVNEDLFG